jgi:hypothetical protein
MPNKKQVIPRALVKITVTDLDKARFFKGKKGIYCDLVLFECENDYGDTGFVTQSLSKEEREAGERGEIVGHWKELEQREERPKPSSKKRYEREERDEPEQDDDIPF